VVIVRAEVDRQKVLQFVRKRPGHQTASHGNCELHTWTETRGGQKKRQVTGCFYQSTMMVFGRDADAVKKALDVLDAKASNLAEGHSPLAAEVPEGTFFVARVAKLADAQLPFKSPIVRQSEFLALTFGERHGEVFAHGELAAKSPGAAEQIQTIVDGFLALAKLQHAEDREMTRLLGAVKVTTSGKTVTVQWRGPADDVLTLIKKAWKKHSKPSQVKLRCRVVRRQPRKATRSLPAALSRAAPIASRNWSAASRCR